MSTAVSAIAARSLPTPPPPDGDPMDMSSTARESTSPSPEEDDVDARQRIQALEHEVTMLTGKASVANNKIAEYESELERLRSEGAPSIPRKPVGGIKESVVTLPDTATLASPLPASPMPSAIRPSILQGLARSFSLRSSPMSLGGRTPSTPSTADAMIHAATAPGTPALGAPLLDLASLEAQIKQEQRLRLEAEKKLTEVNGELEDLSATLFSQANEMVSSERRLRSEGEAAWAAKLEEAETRHARRVAEQEQRAEQRAQVSEERIKVQGDRIKRLEDKVKMLEVREKERNSRLERLEKAMTRAGKLRAMLDDRGRT